jgi:hypothetical protein
VGLTQVLVISRLVQYLSSMPKMKRTFQVEIEAKLLVEAFDEASARKKVEKTFSRARVLDPDVRASGAVWTYDTAIATEPSGA